jgi:hypothetical protein
LSIDKKPDKKKPNPNMQEFVRRYGNKATHLNAFFIERHFDAFKMILRDAVDDHWDEEIYDNMVDEYDVAADDPDEMDEEELLEKRCMMCKTITGSFRPGWPKDVSHPAYEYLDDDGTDEDEDDADSK